MATRLDRLFLLLETGSTPVVRQSAAAQLGQVQKLYPHELNNLLNKVHKYLRSSVWETRIAAGQAVEAISKHVPQWSPPTAPNDEERNSPHPDCGHLSFAQFDVQKVLLHGNSLLGSEGLEYDTEEIFSGLDEKERLARQKQLLNKRLGLDVAGGLGLQSDALFDDEDLIVKKKEQEVQRQQKSVSEIIMQQQMGTCAQMSARERNRAKRKAKLLAKQISREDKQPGVENSNGEPTAKLRKTASVSGEQPADAEKLVIDNVPDHTLNLEEMDEWPFECFCELLLNDLFSSSWETRHGASVGIREVLKLHGNGAGKIAAVMTETMHHWNQVWLEDAAVRLVCVLALDRFGDFVADEVVAPVRETCAQILGVILKYMDAARVQGVVHALLKLLSQIQWEVRHGGLLGIKYLMAVRQDQIEMLLPMVLPAVFAGLQDRDDDVRAVAAAALVPVAESLFRFTPEQVPVITSCLWQTLTDLDDLTASTNSIMGLLSTLLTFSVSNDVGAHLYTLVPRLWPFMRHNIASVRKAALETLYILLQQDNVQNPVAVWLVALLQDVLRHVYQRSLLEHKEEILQLLYKVWGLLLQRSPLDHLLTAVGPWLGVWFCLVMQPAKLPFDNNLLIEAKHTKKKKVPTATLR